jgi:hypothetical protein
MGGLEMMLDLAYSVAMIERAMETAKRPAG